MEPQSDNWLIVKLGTVWAGVGVTSWAEWAGFLASFYTILLIAHWFYVHVFKPLFKRGADRQQSKDDDDELPL